MNVDSPIVVDLIEIVLRPSKDRLHDLRIEVYVSEGGRQFEWTKAVPNTDDFMSRMDQFMRIAQQALEAAIQEHRKRNDAR